MSYNDLPTINACLNVVSAILLLLGRCAIKAGNQEKHQKLMGSALVSSAVFLTCYLIYHLEVGSVPYPHHDWTRPLYFAILIPHVILAAGMVPFIFMAVFFALKKQFTKHKRIVRWLWPVWMYVSVSGIVVYLMLYVF